MKLLCAALAIAFGTVQTFSQNAPAPHLNATVPRTNKVIRVSWNPPANIASFAPYFKGYRVYYGTTSHVYTNFFFSTTTSGALSNAVPHVIYYFAAKTVITNGPLTFETFDFSNEVANTPWTNNLVTLTLQSSTNMSDPLSWKNLSSVPVLVMTNPPGPQVFYRIAITNTPFPSP